MNAYSHVYTRMLHMGAGLCAWQLMFYLPTINAYSCHSLPAVSGVMQVPDTSPAYLPHAGAVRHEHRVGADLHGGHLQQLAQVQDALAHVHVAQR